MNFLLFNLIWFLQNKNSSMRIILFALQTLRGRKDWIDKHENEAKYTEELKINTFFFLKTNDGEKWRNANLKKERSEESCEKLVRLTDFPVKYEDMIMLESSPPLTCADNEIKDELTSVPFNFTLFSFICYLPLTYCSGHLLHTWQQRYAAWKM